MQVQDQSDLEAASISEKTDKMEKTEINPDQKESRSPEGDSPPHEEIKQLQVHLMDMISQVDSLKSTISKMKVDQQKTEHDLKSKDENIDKLAKEIEQLREFKSLSVMGINKYSSTAVMNMEPAEKDTNELNICESLQKATETNLKKIAGKIKDLKTSKSKSSVQSLEKSSKTSTKRPKIEKRKSVEKKASEKKVLKPYDPKNVFGIGSGDVDVPFFRFGMGQSSHVSEKTTKNEFDELD
ncbi:hypothetical protein WA026_012074 [Henosepilachna vigintioctopunctata]|uniref:Uncharacterized protein n=1 Tax=Henosepilachna vigintioctopunctata TaxID=420089 RepID=A0AAW1V4V8_9CUCU